MENAWTGFSDGLAQLVAEAHSGYPHFLGTASMPLEDLLVLYALIVKTRPKVIVESGTWAGYSSTGMALALVDAGVSDGHVWTIDASRHEGVAERVWCSFGVEHRITRVLGDSRICAEPPDKIDFLFLDALHDEAFVQAEIRNFAPRLRPGSLICVHDTNIYESGRATEAVTNSAELLRLRVARGLDVLRWRY